MISSTGKIDRLLVELRPRLQCANFFISFPRKFADIESTTIELGTDRIMIVMKGERERYEIRTGDFFHLHTQTLSSLVIKNRYLCFRVNTNEGVFGSERLNVAGMFASDRNENQFKLACNVEAGERYRVVCNNCSGPLLQETEGNEAGIEFKRVLELPSEQLDTDDWFCHRHDHAHDGNVNADGHGEQSNESRGTKLDPQPNDLFYGYFYALLNRSILNRVHIRHERFVYCKRCLQYLGCTRKNQPSVKLWYENIRFQNHQHPDRLPPMALFRVDDPLELFRQLVRKTVREFNFVTHLGLPPTIKLMFELRRPGLGGDVFYLLAQIMDCQLSVFRIKPNRKRTGSGSSESCSDDIDDERRNENVLDQQTDCLNVDSRGNGEGTGENNTDDDDDDDVFIDSPYQKHTINLERHCAMKLMYRYEKYEEQPLFTFWREDSNVVNLELSEPMFNAAIRYLDANSSFVPECYRVNLGFSMSYLDIS